ncbi:hypothetical protein [Lentilactobacillus parabuchneri]|nr:hypothetical protein [Lentilactobacillus parabuchneri]
MDKLVGTVSSSRASKAWAMAFGIAVNVKKWNYEDEKMFYNFRG